MRAQLLAGFIVTIAATAACSQDAPAVPMEERAREAGQATSDATKDAGARMGAAVETADVKSALTLDKTVDASNINVDTDHTTKVVTLKGFVPSASQRALAESIAKREAEGYRVDNQLVIRGS